MDGEDLEIEDDAPALRSGNTLERFRAVSAALSDAARRTRISTRRSGAFAQGGFKARRGAKVARLLFAASFLVFVALPTLSAATYFFLIASKQYVSETDFTVSTGEVPMPDGVASLTGLPMLAIIQDTQIVTNFVHSRAAVDLLDKRVGVRSLYGSPAADWLARYDINKPVERFEKYWERMTSTSIGIPSGVVQLKIRAFSPEDAQRIAQATVDICEQLVNDLNSRMNEDAVNQAENELKRASKRLGAALASLQEARNASGIIETLKSTDVLNGLVRDTRSSLMSMTGEYESRLKYVNADAPQMRELQTRIDVTRDQIAEIEKKLTSAPASTGSANESGAPTIAQAMTQFGELDLERKVSERLFETSMATLERARMNAEIKHMYFKIFVHPTSPQEAQYPKRELDVFLIAAASITIWGILCGIAAIARNHMA